MDFCSKYDVDLFLTARESYDCGYYDIKNTLLIVYENIVKSKIKKIVDFLLNGTSKDQIQLSNFDGYVIHDGKKRPIIERFKESLMPFDSNLNTGKLNRMIDAAERDIQEFLAANAAKAAKAAEVKRFHAIGKASAQKKALEERQALEDSINELINQSK